MDGETANGILHRQGTFDTDPTQTLVDSSGIVKRGSIELPNIKVTPRVKKLKSKQSRSSIDSQNVDDVSQFLKTLKSTAKVSRAKSKSFKSKVTGDTQEYSQVKPDATVAVDVSRHNKPDGSTTKSSSPRNVQFLGYSTLKTDNTNEKSNPGLRETKTSRSNSFKIKKELETFDQKKGNCSDVETEVIVDSLSSKTSILIPAIKIPSRNKKAAFTDTKMSQNQQSGSGGKMLETYESVFAERKSLLENESAYRKRIKQLEDELYSLLRTTDDLRAENKVLRTKLDRTEEENRELKGDKRIQTLMREGTLSPRPDPDKIEMESQMEKLKEQNRKLEEESKNLQQVTPRDELLALERENGEMRTKIIQLTQQIDDFETENGKIKEEFEKEREILKEEVNKINEKLKVEAERPDGEKVQLKEQIVELQTENQGLNKELANLKEKSERSHKLIMELEKERISLQSSVTAVESEKLTELQHLKNEFTRIESEKESLKSAKEELESTRDNLLSENKELQSKLSDLETSYKDITESLEQKKTEVTELTSALKSNNGAESELQKERQEKKKVQKQCDEFQKSMEAKIKELGEVKIQKDKLESEKIELKKEFESYKKSSDSKSSDLSKVETELKETKQKLQKEMDKQEKLLKGAEEMTNELLGKNKELQKLQQKSAKNKNEKEKAVAELETSNEEKESLKREIAFLKKEIDDLKRHAKLNSSDLGDQLKNIKKELSESKEDNVNLSSELDTKKEECEDLSKQLRDINLRMEKINAKIKEMESERKDWLVHKEKYLELESSYKRILEENKHLRALSGREDGWVAGLFDDKDVRKAEYVGSINARKMPRPRKKDKLIINPVDRTNKASRSMGDLRQDDETLSQKSTPSLPSIDELDNSRLTFGLGYRQIYKNRMKAAAKYKRT